MASMKRNHILHIASVPTTSQANIFALIISTRSRYMYMKHVHKYVKVIASTEKLHLGLKKRNMHAVSWHDTSTWPNDIGLASWTNEQRTVYYYQLDAAVTHATTPEIGLARRRCLRPACRSQHYWHTRLLA